MSIQLSNFNATKSLLLIMLSIFVSSSAFSTVTRTRTMGDAAMLIEDEANYWLLPSAVIHSDNRIVFELGGQPELIFYSPANYGFARWAGGTVAFGQDRKNSLGAFWSEAAAAQPFVVFPISLVAADQKMDLFYGRKTSSGSFGVHLSYGAGLRQLLNERGADSETSLNVTQVELGSSTRNWDGALGLQLGLFSNSGSSTNAYGLHLLSRWRKTATEKLTLVPWLDFSIDSENKDNSAKSDGRFWSFWTGLGLHYQVEQGDLVVLGFSIMRTSQVSETEASTSKIGQTVLELPFVFGGLETELFTWLKLRFGFQKALRRITQSTEFRNNSMDDTHTTAPFAATAGLGLGYRRLTLDLSWDWNFLQRGPYFLSGKTGDMFNLASMCYRF